MSTQFTKRIKGLCGLEYSQRLEHIGLETLQLRRIKYDLLMCYKIISGEVSLHCNLLDLSGFTQTRGHKYKLYKHQSNVNAYKYFFCNRICDTWNALPHTVVEAPSLNTFKRLLNNVVVCHAAVLP